jgi:hypothetical protein
LALLRLRYAFSQLDQDGADRAPSVRVRAVFGAGSRGVSAVARRQCTAQLAGLTLPENQKINAAPSNNSAKDHQKNFRCTAGPHSWSELRDRVIERWFGSCRLLR